MVSEFRQIRDVHAGGIKDHAQNGFGWSRAEDLRARPVRSLILSCQLLTDRMLLYSSWLSDLALQSDPTVWVTGLDDIRKREVWRGAPGTVEPFPEVKPFRETYNYFRRFNEFTWDSYLRPPSRLSMLEHVRRKTHSRMIKLLYGPARLAAGLKLAGPIERLLEKALLGPERSPEARRRLRELNPDVVITTDPFCYLEPAVIAEAKKLGIKTLAVITSWDNLSTKNRMVLRYDGYIVWSDQMRRDLHEFYPYTANAPCYVVGAPQFDLFFQERYRQSREEFCQRQGLQPGRPIVVYALGSPNFLKELPGAVEFAKRLANSDLQEVQLLVRPHPMFFNGVEIEAFRDFGDNVKVQTSGDRLPLANQIQNDHEIADWVNTFLHANVVVNLSSTVAIDAAIFDRPVINLDFDPEPSRPNQALVKDVNHRWTHFKPIAESGGLWLVNSFEEMVDAVRAYLTDPGLHREKRRWIAEYVCGNLDGKCGDRMSGAILDFTRRYCAKNEIDSGRGRQSYAES